MNKEKNRIPLGEVAGVITVAPSAVRILTRNPAVQYRRKVIGPCAI